jgi:hypothetical protein
LLFVLPLLIVYEVGVMLLGGPNPETVRNGADHWLRCGLGALGLSVAWLPPAILVAGFVVWVTQRTYDRPGDLLGTLSGMALESVVFALGLFAISRALAPLLLQAGVELSVTNPADMDPPQLAAAEPALRQVVTYLGAGIYEEALFRLGLFSALVFVLQAADLPRAASVLLAGLASAALFSAAHHIGPYGQTYTNYLFLFRLLAGLYFALLFQIRGFGIAVGAHACYNVLVSVT